MPVWGTALWKSLGEFRRCVKVGHVSAFQNSQVWKVTGIHKQTTLSALSHTLTTTLSCFIACHSTHRPLPAVI